MLLKENAISFEMRKSPSGSTYKVYTFECSECGVNITAQIGQLKSHSGRCRSCSQRKRPYEHIWNELKHSCAKVKHLEISLTYEELVNAIQSSKCHYCEKELIYNKYSRSSTGKHHSRAYQLDRKDNNIGYTVENVVPCCWNCNRMKSDIYTYEEFMKLSPILKEIHANKFK